MRTTIAILYGINEGPAMGRRLRHELERAGFAISKDPTAADIIFAHSGGCLLVPAKNRAQYIVQVGIPYWPHRPWLLATVRKVSRELAVYQREHRLAAWFRKALWHAFYAFNLLAAIRMARNLSLTGPWNGPQPQIVVRNRHDVYCSPAIVDTPFRGPRTFLSLPGEHDDCWEHPERYVHLLQSLQ